MRPPAPPRRYGQRVLALRALAGALGWRRRALLAAAADGGVYAGDPRVPALPPYLPALLRVALDDAVPAVVSAALAALAACVCAGLCDVMDHVRAGVSPRRWPPSQRACARGYVM